MATDCYQKFLSVYRQGIADGLAVAVATAAAQEAMKACLSQQTTRPSTVAQSFTQVSGGRVADEGPTLKK